MNDYQPRHLREKVKHSSYTRKEKMQLLVGVVLITVGAILGLTSILWRQVSGMLMVGFGLFVTLKRG